MYDEIVYGFRSRVNVVEEGGREGREIVEVDIGLLNGDG